MNYNDLSRVCDDNKYTLEYFSSLVRLQSGEKEAPKISMSKISKVKWEGVSVSEKQENDVYDENAFSGGEDTDDDHEDHDDQSVNPKIKENGKEKTLEQPKKKSNQHQTKKKRN
eukprot:gene932-1177_t